MVFYLLVCNLSLLGEGDQCDLPPYHTQAGKNCHLASNYNLSMCQCTALNFALFSFFFLPLVSISYLKINLDYWM